jgi:hypothetical protein
MNYPIIHLSVAIGLLLLSLTVPWFVTKLFGEQFYSPLEIIRTLSSGNLQISNSNNNGIGNDPISQM